MGEDRFHPCSTRPTCGCTRHQVDPDAKDRITICGTVQRQDDAPVSNALLELHKLAKDTPDDVKANSYELGETDGSGLFVLSSAYAERQYWLSIKSTRGCEGLSMADMESKRLPVAFSRSAAEGDCDSKINLLLDDHCGLKLR
jgi:hypothetical protein